MTPGGWSGLALAFTISSVGQAQTPAGDEVSAGVFRRYADHTAKIQVVESGSGAKASLGSAFFVDARGYLLTNYHVVAEAVDDSRYRIEWLDQTGVARPARILAVDVIRDLAVVGTGRPTSRFFALTSTTIAKGTRIYSLGHPEDLGLSIVEGVYNGLLEHTLYPKIHFSGPLNSGMSGGPALTQAGAVVGVNVATAGNSLSFLVPIDAALPLLERAKASTGDEPDFAADIGRQILDNQATYLGTLFQGSDSTVRIGPFDLPTQPAPFFRCWADANRDAEALFESVDHQCSTDDAIYLSGSQSSGIVSLSHRVLVSRGLNPLRFFSLYTAEFRQHRTEFEVPDDVTDYQCQNNNVRHHGMVMRTQFCVRRYTKYDGLYDAELKAAVLGARDAGVITSLSLSGVSFENAQRLTKKYLERIRWASH